MAITLRSDQKTLRQIAILVWNANMETDGDPFIALDPIDVEVFVSLLVEEAIKDAVIVEKALVRYKIFEC